jgi:hypothetical protein
MISIDEKSQCDKTICNVEFSKFSEDSNQMQIQFRQVMLER